MTRALSQIHTLGGAGMRFIFDYMLKEVVDGASHNRDALSKARIAAKLGEPWLFGLDPDTVGDYLAAFNFKLLKDYDAKELHTKYCPERSTPMNYIRIVVCDRYVIDLLVDLANNFGYDQKEIIGLCHSWLLALFPKPDLYFLLDLPAEVAFARKEDVPLSYLRDRRALYLGLAEFCGAEILDGNVTIGQLKQSIQDKTWAFLERGGTRDRQPSPDHRN